MKKSSKTPAKKSRPIKTAKKAARTRRAAKATAKPNPDESLLTGKQLAFVTAYVGEARFNATAAARIAGYDGNDQTLRAVGYENLTKPHIAHEIKLRLAEVQMSQEEVLLELADVARSEWRDHLIIKRDREGNEIDAKLMLKDKVKALELLGKAHKLFVDKVEHKGTVHTVGLTLDEWKQQAAARRAEAAGAVEALGG